MKEREDKVATIRRTAKRDKFKEVILALYKDFQSFEQEIPLLIVETGKILNIILYMILPV